MDTAHFDTLTRRVGQQTSRRAALVALAGGALLLRQPPPAAGRPLGLKPISIVITNTTTRSVQVEHRDNDKNRCCRWLDARAVGPGERAAFNGNQVRSAVWIDTRAWFDFNNPKVGRPEVSAREYGQSQRFWCCTSAGTEVVRARSLKVNQSTTMTVAGQVYTERRTRDTNYKVFEITPPQ